MYELIHQHQLKNMSLSQRSTGIKMSNWTEEVMEFLPCCSVQNELSQAQNMAVSSAVGILDWN